MPRQDATDAFVAALESGIIRPAFLVEAHFLTGPEYLWTGVGSFSWNGHTWLGVGTAGDVSTIEESSNVEAKGITLTLSGIDPTILGDTLNECQQGLPAIVYLAQFDGTPALIPDPVIAFAGRMDQPTLDLDGTSATISIACESRLADMNTPAERRYTNEDQQRDYPSDMGFQFVNSIQEVTIYWGRTPSSSNNL